MKVLINETFNTIIGGVDLTESFAHVIGNGTWVSAYCFGSGNALSKCIDVINTPASNSNGSNKLSKDSRFYERLNKLRLGK